MADLETFMDDDFATPKVLATLFDVAPTINSLKDGLIPLAAINNATLKNVQAKFTFYLEEVLGLQSENEANNEKLKAVMQLLIDVRKEAKANKDFFTSDTIRNRLQAAGIVLKDEKNGNMSWTIA